MEIIIEVLLYHLTFSVPLVSTVLKLSVHHVELREKMYKYTCSPAGILRNPGKSSGILTVLQESVGD